MHQALRILMTNNTLADRAGSELYIRDLALALVRRGHSPVAYSMSLGEVAEELRQATVPVIDNLDDLSVAPDIIHGQHHLETMSAMLHFPEVPAVFACHGWSPWPEIPPVFPRIQRYVAVDDLCREKIFTTPGIRPEQVEVLYNFVDLSRFCRRQGLPVRAQTAVVFSNYVSEGVQLDNIRRACARMGISRVDVVGSSSGNAVEQPEKILGNYDLVFAKARCALEALASGCAVVVAGVSGLGGLVTTGNMHRLRVLNFGTRTMQNRTLSVDNLIHELEQYDAEDASRVSDWICRDADLEKAADRWVEIYCKALDDKKIASPGDGWDESRAAARYVRFLADRIKSSTQALHRKNVCEEELRQQEILNADLQKRLRGAATELDAVKHSRIWRLFSPYRKMRSRLRRGS